MVRQWQIGPFSIFTSDFILTMYIIIYLHIYNAGGQAVCANETWLGQKVSGWPVSLQCLADKKHGWLVYNYTKTWDIMLKMQTAQLV